MPSYKRTHLLPAGIAGLGASLAIAVAMVGPATAAQNVAASHILSAVALPGPVVTSALQPGQTDSLIGFVVSIVDPIAWTPALAPVAALQPGQTDSFIAAGNSSASIGGAQSTSALGPTSALQPGQTFSSVAPGNGSGSIGGATPLTSALGPDAAPQPGQTGW